jgi:phage regulator Rha-like protein
VNIFLLPSFKTLPKCTWHLKTTEATYIQGNKKYMLNFTATANGSVAVTNSFAAAAVQGFMFSLLVLFLVLCI